MSTTNSSERKGHKFGTFGGVFTPSILTIFGLIMFMRANYVVGQAGVIQALFILTISSSITFLTGLSISAISTNTPVGGGGAYFLISRVLGPGFGTAIGLALFLAQALSVPFYILGFTEALFRVVGLPPSLFLPITLGAALLLFALGWVGANYAIKFQYLILAILFSAIAAFMIGGVLTFDPGLFSKNLSSHYADGHSLWSIFAIYFPAVTGIMAGVNMSGDLRDPAKSIPLGSLSAVVLSYFVYGGQIIIFAGVAAAESLRARPFDLLMESAWLDVGLLIACGAFAATLSSGIGSYLGAPRVLQALARDNILPFLEPFGLGAKKSGEPRRALLLTLGITLVTLLLAGDGQSGGLNQVASVVTMVFLYTYGMTNLAAFVESFGANPSFRPRFKLYHWSTALLGTGGCVWAAFQISAGAATAAGVFVAALFFISRKRQMQESFGDARRGFIYQNARNALLTLDALSTHPKNWRPTILVFTGNPHARATLLQYANWISANRGIVTAVNLLIGDLKELKQQREEEFMKLREFLRKNRFNAFAEVVVLENFDRDLHIFLQAHSFGPLKSNIVLVGWPKERERLSPYFKHLRSICEMHKSLVISIGGSPLLTPNSEKRIDCWWRGMSNGSLMIILLHLVIQSPEWKGAKIRLIRLAHSKTEREQGMKELREIAEAARINADLHVPVSDKNFNEIFREESQDATLVTLGLLPPNESGGEAFFDYMEELLRDMPPALLVNSSGEADLLA